MERIQPYLGNLVRTYNIQEAYAYEGDLCMGILSDVVFVIHSTQNMLRGYTLVQLVFGHNIILHIKYYVHWELIRQQKQTQMNYDNNR